MFLFFLIACRQEKVQEQFQADDPFPLDKGNYWVYEGNVRWTEVPDKVKEKNITWKMEVVEVFDREHLHAAIIKGHPSDLAWYEEGLNPGDHLILKVGNSKFYLVSQPRAGEIMKRLKNPDDYLGNLVTEQELFLEYPLLKGAVFGDTGQFTRPDMFYFWFVEAAEKIRPEGIKGLTSEKEMDKYVLTYQSAPDHQNIGFIPGVGISSYTYVHHGTVSEAYLKLVEFSKVKPKAKHSAVAPISKTDQ